MKQERKSITGWEEDLNQGYLTCTVLGCGSFQVNVAHIVGEEVYDTLSDVGKAGILHGFKQKVGDKAALSRDTNTGRSASPQDKFDAMREEAQRLNEGGSWNVLRSNSSTKRLDRAALFEALSEVSGRSAQEVAAKFASREDEVLRTFLERADIAAAYAKRTARDSGKADALLAELEG